MRLVSLMGILGMTEGIAEAMTTESKERHKAKKNPKLKQVMFVCGARRLDSLFVKDVCVKTSAKLLFRVVEREVEERKDSKAVIYAIGMILFIVNKRKQRID